MSTTGDYIAAQKDDHSPENVSPWYRDGDVTLYAGDAARVLAALPAGCVNTCVTSPPYFGLRDYGTGDAQVGMEDTPERYVERLVGIFREVRRVLRDDGTLWVNLGDIYRNKRLLGIPWRVALALQADGWYLRSDIIWHKPNPVPHPVKDRPTTAHEYLFLLSKSPRYHYDSDAISEPAKHAGKVVTLGEKSLSRGQANGAGIAASGNGLADSVVVKPTRNKRTVWTVSKTPYSGAHFAVFPPALIEPCVLAGSLEGGTVLDPFIGSGTTAEVARSAGRRCIGIDLNAEYLALAAQRLGLEDP